MKGGEKENSGKKKKVPRRTQRPVEENSQGGDPSTLEINSQGQDPRTFEGNSQGEDPSTFGVRNHQAKRWRVQEERKEEK